MLTNISWGNYIVVVVLLMGAWYLVVGLRFYADDIRKIITGERKLQFHGLSTPANQEPEPLHSHDSPEAILNSAFAESDSTFDDVDNLIERLKTVIADSSQRKLVKEEFINYLSLVLKEYPTVKTSPFKSSISEFIVSECDRLEALDLTQEEAEALWNEAN